MNADLTIDTLTFAQQYSDESGSRRVEVSRGVNLPEIMMVKHRPYTDSALKRPGIESALIFERHLTLADGTIVPAVRATLKVQRLVDSGVVSADVTAVTQRIVTVIQEDDSGLDLADEIFISQQQ
jgi:hypothetical protein